LYRSSKNEAELVNISIVIAAKNESGNIGRLVDSLRNLDYPKDLFEVIFVDDNSSDNTYDKFKQETESVKNFSVKELKETGGSGKREALSFGISCAKFAYILISDADCRPQSKWLRACSNKFCNHYQIIFGIAPFYRNKNIWNNISCFENLRSTLFSFSMAVLGLPYTASARNFGFTKDAFNSLEGYSNTMDTLSGDDDLLLREAVKKKLKIGAVIDSDSFVFSETKNNFHDYFQQRARHTQTAFHYLKMHQSILVFWHLLNLSFLFSPILMIFNPLLGFLFPVKLIMDSVSVKIIQKKIGYDFSVFEILYLQVIYELFLIVHIFNARFSDIKWK
jgi:cellulose synthase/poly-beta-1,6-N-acetylglucosamine synthase-like glycosyltransferase